MIQVDFNVVSLIVGLIGVALNCIIRKGGVWDFICLYLMFLGALMPITATMGLLEKMIK